MTVPEEERESCAEDSEEAQASFNNSAKAYELWDPFTAGQRQDRMGDRHEPWQPK